MNAGIHYWGGRKREETKLPTYTDGDDVTLEIRAKSSVECTDCNAVGSYDNWVSTTPPAEKIDGVVKRCPCCGGLKTERIGK